jgi:hypothetical protein
VVPLRHVEREGEYGVSGTPIVSFEECLVFCQTTAMVAMLSWFILAFPGLLTSSKGDI